MTLINNPHLFGCATCTHFLPDSGKGGKGFCPHKHEVMRGTDSCADWAATEEEKAGIEIWTLNIRKDENNG